MSYKLYHKWGHLGKDMVNQARMSAEIKDDDLGRAASSISAYLAGKKQPAKEAAAAEAFLNTLPKDQIEKLKSLSMKEHYTGPELEPGVIYEIWIDRAKIMSDSLDAAYQIRNSISGLANADPKAKEKLLDVIDVVKPAAPHQAVAPVELAVQQQQAYLKVLNYDLGKKGLDGIAGEGSQTHKALDEFARKHGIDPKDTSKINDALLTEALSSQAGAPLIARQKAIEAGKASADDIKTVQWLLKGAGANMPLSLRGDKMDGIAGPETKTVLKAHTYNSGNERDASITNLPQKVMFADPKIDPQLQKFYESLSPEQRDIQKKIAARGGSQPYGEAVGILYELADNYFHGRKVQGNIYDGGFPQGTPDHFRFPYEPSEEVYKLKKEFDKSLTPEQRKLREQYESSEAKRDVGLKRVVLPELEVIGQSPLELFRENTPDLLGGSLKSSESLKTGIDNKSSQSPGYEDVLGKRGIDLSGAFRSGALGEMVSAPSSDAGVALGNQKLFEMPTVRPMGGAPKI